MHFLRQYTSFLATITCNILSASYGASSGWGAPNFLLLTSEDSPLKSGPISTSEASLAVSMPFFGTIIGIAIYSLVMDRLSRKILLVSIAIPQILSWSVLLLTSNLYYLYAARLVMGVVGGGLMKVIPVYVSEIATNKNRGTLNSMMILSGNAGFLFGLVVASFFDYFGQIKANIMLPVLFVVAFNFFPETPEYLLKRNHKNAAEKSRNFYNGVKSMPSLDRKDVDLGEKVYQQIENESTSLSFSDFCTPVAKKAIAIVLFVGALNQFCGALAMTSYTNKIFEEAGSTLPSNTASIIVASMQLIANFVTIVLVDRAGRKILNIISALGTAVGLICMGLYDLYKDRLGEYGWIPIASFSTAIFMASIGMLPLTYVILSEIVPKKIQNVVSFLCLEIIYILAFILISFFPILTRELGSSNCMFIFAGCCLFGTIFHLIVLPETKGKSYEEIMKALEK